MWSYFFPDRKSDCQNLLQQEKVEAKGDNETEESKLLDDVLPESSDMVGGLYEVISLDSGNNSRENTLSDKMIMEECMGENCTVCHEDGAPEIYVDEARTSLKNETSTLLTDKITTSLRNENKFEFPCTYNTLGDLTQGQEHDAGVSSSGKTQHLVFVHDTFLQDSTLLQTLSRVVENYNNESHTHSAAHINVLTASVNPIGSSYDRAIQLFHYLKGEACYFGKRNDCDGASDFDTSIHMYGTHPEWSESNPVAFVCVGYGGNTVRELLYLLSAGKVPRFETGRRQRSNETSYYDTNMRWVRCVVCIASPLCGIYQSESLSDSFLCDSFSRYFVLKYLGWMHLFSTSVRNISAVQRLNYYQLGFRDSIHLSVAKLNERMGSGHIFAETRIRRCLELCRQRYSKIGLADRPPVICVGLCSATDSVNKIPIYIENPSRWVDNDGVVSTYSQKHFFGPSVEPVEFESVPVPELERGDYVYFALDGVSHADVTDILDNDPLIFRKRAMIENLCAELLNIIRQQF